MINFIYNRFYCWRLREAYRKIHKFGNVLAFFSTQEWTFRNDNVLKLWDKMNATDKKKYNFDMASIEWDEFLFYNIRGVRVFLGNDPMSTLKEGQKWFKKWVTWPKFMWNRWIIMLYFSDWKLPTLFWRCCCTLSSRWA